MISVLYVDDEAALLDITKLFLERSGPFQVTTTLSARKAFDQLAHQSFDAIISDYQMPEMDGIDFLKMVRASGNSIPFILFTGKGREEIVIQALNEGADFYLQKGGDPKSQFTELAHKVKAAIKQKHADNALKESEEKYRFLFEQNPAPMLIYERSTLQILAVNEVFQRHYGYSYDELLSMFLTDLHPEEEKGPVADMAHRLRGHARAEEWHHLRSDGTLIAIVAYSQNLRFHEKEARIATITDISDQKRAEEELQAAYEELAAQEEELRTQFEELKQRSEDLHQSEERYRSVIESVPAGMHFYELEPDGRLIFIGGNPAADAILNISHDTLVGKTIEEAFPPLAGTPIPGQYLDVISTGTVWRTEQVNYQDGQIKGSFIVSAFRTAENRMAAAFFDITDRKRAEEEVKGAYEKLAAQEEELRAQYDSLAMSEAEWESTFNGITDWISVISPDGQIIRSNNAIESLTGIPASQVIGQNCFELIHGTPCTIDNCPKSQMLKTGNREFADIRKPDGKGWLQVTVDPIFDATGDVVCAAHIVRDITEQKRTQKALEQAKKKLNLLNYVTFNDILNMIFILSGYQQLAKESIADTAAITLLETEEEIIRKITYSLKFAQSYQDLGLKPPQWQNAHQIFLMGISHIDFSQITHTSSIADLEIFTDPLLEQVFQILADNTLTHGKKATQVILRYIQGPKSLTLIFEDDGEGIPEDIKEKIFSSDFQTLKGIGLFLAREVLAVTDILIRETGKSGEGARFEIEIPRECYRIHTTENS